MQFSIRTRSSNGLVLASGINSTYFIAIGLNGGKVELIYRYWLMGAEERIQGGRYCYCFTVIKKDKGGKVPIGAIELVNSWKK